MYKAYSTQPHFRFADLKIGESFLFVHDDQNRLVKTGDIEYSSGEIKPRIKGKTIPYAYVYKELSEPFRNKI